MTESGTYICYERKKFREADLRTIQQANSILGPYEKNGIGLTLRGLYYQFVSRALFENDDTNYQMLKRVISDARVAGLVSWTAIEDRERGLRGVECWDDPLGALRTARDRYKRDLWANQPMRPEVWMEKRGMEGVVGAICDRLRVDFFATKGYNSQSEQWRAGQRLAGYVHHGQTPIVFYLGDHDPSGIDMVRDNRERLAMFAGLPVTVVRLALNMDQVRKYNPPPNPAKLSDSRSADYVAQYGHESWEIDALEPSVIQKLIEDAVDKVRDEAKWAEALAAEAGDKDALDQVIEDNEA